MNQERAMTTTREAPRIDECAGGVEFDQNGYCPECGASEDDTCGKQGCTTFKHGLYIVQLERELSAKDATIAELREALQSAPCSIDGFDRLVWDCGERRCLRCAALAKVQP